MASEINREELRNVLPDMDEMRKLLINESDTDNKINSNSNVTLRLT